MPKAKDTILKKICFAPDEWKEIERRAELTGKKPNDYIREIAMFGQIKVYSFEEYKTMLFPLRSVGQNINQIAKVVNSTGNIFAKDIEDLRAQVEKLEQTFDEYFSELKYELIE